MAVVVEIDDERVRVRLTGLDRLLGLGRAVTVPLAAISETRVVAAERARREQAASRMPGYFGANPPSVRANGNGWRNRRDLWLVRGDPDELLVIKVIGQPEYGRVVVGVPEPRAVARRIEIARTNRP